MFYWARTRGSPAARANPGLNDGTPLGFLKRHRLTGVLPKPIPDGGLGQRFLSATSGNFRIAGFNKKTKALKLEAGKPEGSLPHPSLNPLRLPHRMREPQGRCFIGFVPGVVPLRGPTPGLNDGTPLGFLKRRRLTSMATEHNGFLHVASTGESVNGNVDAW